jgi:hypothetical protein
MKRKRVYNGNIAVVLCMKPLNFDGNITEMRR